MHIDKKRLYEIIFEADTREGKLFDKILLGVIVFSILVVMVESIGSIQQRLIWVLRIIEWLITISFTIEYITRIWVSDKPIRYVLSFYGVIDLLALLPTYLSFFITGGQSLLVIRGLRLLRIFRILKLSRYTRAGKLLVFALWNSREKITVFVIFVLTLSIIIGTLMYLIEGQEHGFTDIPTSIYWAIVTLTTVGYGDMSPQTGLGQFMSSIVMILGYSIIAVPTGIVTATMFIKQNRNSQVCSKCMFDDHDDDALYCKKCGNSLDKKK
jgi:voltage-gated potassium channel